MGPVNEFGEKGRLSIFHKLYHYYQGIFTKLYSTCTLKTNDGSEEAMGGSPLPLEISALLKCGLYMNVSYSDYVSKKKMFIKN